LWRTQDDISALITSSVLVRQFMPALPSGLLQIESYARAVLTPAVPGATARDVDRAVAHRLATQSTLADSTRRFVFVLTEQAVRWPRAPRMVMAAQVEHLATVSTLPNVDLAVLPLSSGTVVHRDPKDIAYHEALFDHFRDHALRGDEATVWLSTVAGQCMRDRD
jgi:hypothetical protein